MAWLPLVVGEDAPVEDTLVWSLLLMRREVPFGIGVKRLLFGVGDEELFGEVPNRGPAFMLSSGRVGEMGEIGDDGSASWSVFLFGENLRAASERPVCAGVSVTARNHKNSQTTTM